MRNPFSRMADALDRLVCLLSHADPVVERKLDRIITMLEQSKTREKQMAVDLSVLQAEVERNTEIDQSAIVLLNGLAAKIEELKADPVALQAFADSLRGSSDQLAAAVAANTPSE